MLSKWLESLVKKNRLFYAYSSPVEGVLKLKEIDGSRFGFLGSFSVSSRRTKIYNIKEPILDWQGVLLVGTEIAKALLLMNSPPKGYRKITAEQLEKTPPPLFAMPWTGEGVYLDIKSCYYFLLSKLYGIKYARDRWLGYDKEIGEWTIPEEFKDILEKYKAIRNAIYGIMRAKVRITWKEENGKIIFAVQNTKNPLFYPDVPLAIMDITHAISSIAVEVFKAKYVAIDGFILPYKTANKFKSWLEELGFTVGIKAEGYATVKNFYTYAIGDKKTKTFNTYSTAKNIQSNLFLNVDKAYEILKKFAPLLKR